MSKILSCFHISEFLVNFISNYFNFSIDDVIETSPTRPAENISASSSIIITDDSFNQSKSIPEFIVLDSDDDDQDFKGTDSFEQDANSTYFIDRSSSFTAPSQPTVNSNEDYHEEDSKYAQLPSLNRNSEAIVRPIISKHQRRKHNTTPQSSKPLVSAIDRIIDHMDQSSSVDNSSTMEQQNILIKQIKKKKKKKKKKLNNSINN